MKTIMVQMSSREWTMQAMHLACAMARNTQSDLALLHLRRVTQPALLGSGLGIDLPSDREHEILNECKMIAEDYGAVLTMQQMEYEWLLDALVQAANYLQARAVFADLPKSVFVFWQHFQEWNLRRQLDHQGCQLYTLTQPERTGEWVPSISLRVTK